MKKIKGLYTIVAVITLTAFFAGCADTKEGRKTQGQGTALGTVGGAALGALLGYATGGAQGAARGAIAGGAIGAAAGFAYGTHVAHQKAKYATTELWLDQCIASAHEANHKAYAYNQSLSQKIAALDARSKAAVAAKNKSEIRKIKGEIAGLKKEATVQSQQVDNELDAQKGASDDQASHTAANHKAYEKELGELRQTKAGISKNINHLASLESQTNL